LFVAGASAPSAAGVTRHWQQRSIVTNVCCHLHASAIHAAIPSIFFVFAGNQATQVSGFCFPEHFFRGLFSAVCRLPLEVSQVASLL
jgi:hypothetical protein